jgi:hypothetical protein
LASELSACKKNEKEFREREKELIRKHSKTAYFQEELQKAQTQITMLENKIRMKSQEKVTLEEEISNLRDQLHEKDGKRPTSEKNALLVNQGNEMVEGFESVVEDLYGRLGEAEEENRELTQSLEINQEELMKKYQLGHYYFVFHFWLGKY